MECGKLEEILKELEKKKQFIWKLEHIRRDPEEAVVVHTYGREYWFWYNHSDKLLKYGIVKDKNYEKIGVICNTNYETFDNVFMRVYEMMYKTWGSVIVYDMPSHKKTVVYPVPPQGFFNSSSEDITWIQPLCF